MVGGGGTWCEVVFLVVVVICGGLWIVDVVSRGKVVVYMDL